MRCVVDHQVGDAPADRVSFWLVCPQFPCRQASLFEDFRRGGFRLCPVLSKIRPFLTAVKRHEAGADKLANNLAAALLRKRYRYVGDPQIPSVVICFRAVDIAFEWFFQLWSALAELYRFLTARNFCAPLRPDADKHSLFHVPSPSLSVPLEYSVYSVFPCPSVRYGRKTSSTLAIPASMIAI